MRRLRENPWATRAKRVSWQVALAQPGGDDEAAA